MAPQVPVGPAGPRVVVIGGGVVGASCAHFLVKRGYKPIVIEQCGVACHSSGKAGGFLALNWTSGAVGKLAMASFKLHQELAEEFGAERIGYRQMKCVECGFGSSLLQGGSPEQAWLDKTSGFSRELGTYGTVAQVNPKWLTEALMETCVTKGGQLIHAKATGVDIVHEEGGLQRVRAVLTDSGEVECDAVVVAMGAWSEQASSWFPGSGLPSQTVGHKYTSVIWDTTTDDTAVFLDSRYEVEIYPRAYEVYACGRPQNAFEDKST